MLSENSGYVNTCRMRVHTQTMCLALERTSGVWYICVALTARFYCTRCSKLTTQTFVEDMLEVFGDDCQRCMYYLSPLMLLIDALNEGKILAPLYVHNKIPYDE